MVFLTNYKMIILTSQIKQKIRQPKSFVFTKSSICKYKNKNNK
jgi:hypothetical protein